MTKQEAKQKLQEGHKITHTYFTNEEYIHLINGTEYFEDGVKVPNIWWNKNYLLDGWRIFQ